MRVALVNTNRIKPPIGPIGLEYVAETLVAAGHQPEILDLCWCDDWQTGLANFFQRTSFDLVGFTLRNTDDCAFSSRQSFLGEFAEMVKISRGHTDALLVVGGMGFSTMPDCIMRLTEADTGIYRDGEFVFTELADCIEGKKEWRNLPNLIIRKDGKLRHNPPVLSTVSKLPLLERNYADNRRYFLEGGQAGVETKRGCSMHCIYCTEPLAKGNRERVRPARDVAHELEKLLEQGIDHIHTCDSEFNIPEWHALEVCREIISRGLGEKLRWYAYCSPVPFSRELAREMKRAGCAGINFGVDSGDATMLKRLKRNFTPGDILNTAGYCKEESIAVMFDLLLGSPGETENSIIRTVETMKCSGVDRVGVCAGVRVYPGTELAHMVIDNERKEGLIGGDDPYQPLFFLDPGIAQNIFELLDQLLKDDEHFFFFDPSKPEKNYNYNANQRLVDAINRGYRGAYWDILRRIKDIA